MQLFVRGASACQVASIPQQLVDRLPEARAVFFGKVVETHLLGGVLASDYRVDIVVEPLYSFMEPLTKSQKMQFDPNFCSGLRLDVGDVYLFALKRIDDASTWLDFDDSNSVRTYFMDTYYLTPKSFRDFSQGQKLFPLIRAAMKHRDMKAACAIEGLLASAGRFPGSDCRSRRGDQP